MLAATQMHTNHAKQTHNIIFFELKAKASSALLLMECLLGLDLPRSVGFIVWVFGFEPKSWGSIWLSLSEGFIYLL